MSIRYGRLKAQPPSTPIIWGVRRTGPQLCELLDEQKTWTTEKEMEFIDRYAEKRPDNALRYCELILGHRRIWDDTVNVGKLLMCVAIARDQLRQSMSRVA